MRVMIGVDPHKGSHTAVAIDKAESELARLKVRATRCHHYATYNGTAPIDVSSGGRVVQRLSRRGNRQLNHAIHIAAVTLIRHPHSPGRPFYDRKIDEGKTKKEALRALKRRISDAVYRQLLLDAKQA